MRIDLRGRTALVTGASRGIGKEIARSLVEAGVFVCGSGTNQASLGRTALELGSGGGTFVPLAARLENADEVARLAERANEALGGVDILVNNAGILHLGPLAATNDRILENSFAVNVLAPIRLSRALVPDMIERGWGRVINICSSSAYFGGGTPGHCVYSATKHALLGFSRALDEELRSDGIRVGTVSPAGVSTDMVADRTDIPAASLMSPQDVAEAVVFLASSDGPGIVYELRMWRMNR